MLHYVVKVFLKFQDWDFLTHAIYDIISDEIKAVLQIVEDTKQDGVDTAHYESLCRLVRTRFIIDCATHRKDCFKRNVTMLETAIGKENEILKLIGESVDFAKNYICLLSFNFSVEVEGNFDMDIMQLKE